MPIGRHYSSDCSINLSPAKRDAIFRDSLAATLRDQAIAVRRSNFFRKVGLTGGAFQNRRLTERAIESLRDANFEVLLPERVPGKDAGLSFGQIVETAAGARVN